eukprot:EG_transcript_12121
MHELAILIFLCFLLPWSESSQHPPDLSAADIAKTVGFAPFARVQGGGLSAKEWEAAACPLETTSYSCYWHNFTRGWEAEHRPISGAKRLFSTATFESLIRCRDLIIVGDSVAIQFYQTLICLLRHSDTQFAPFWVKSFHDKLCPFGKVHCLLHNTCTIFPHLSARICVFMDTALRYGPSQYGVQNDSIIVANSALHHGSEKTLSRSLEAFVADYAQLPRAARPTVVWAETPPQHFSLHPVGYYGGRNLNYSGCVPTDRDVAYANDWRNRVPERYMAAAGIPILRVWNITQPLWNFHVVYSGRVNAEPVDCTHYCVPGATLPWAVALTDLLETLIAPKSLACKRRELVPEAELFPPKEKRNTA